MRKILVLAGREDNGKFLVFLDYYDVITSIALLVDVSMLLQSAVLSRNELVSKYGKTLHWFTG